MKSKRIAQVTRAVKRVLRLRIVSDLHVMSKWGVLPPSFCYKGEPFAQSEVNRWLWECLKDMRENYPTPDAIVSNGDSRDGPQWRNRGTEVKSTDRDFQDNAAFEALSFVMRGIPVRYLTEGTGYHEEDHEGLSIALGAKEWEDGSHYGQVLDMKMGGHKLNIAHHPEGGAVLYKGTAMDRTALWATLAGAYGHVPNCDVVVRSHWHFSALFAANNKTVIQTAGFQMQTPHMAKAAYFRYQPSVGFCDILLEPGEDPIVQRRNYPLPPKAVVDVDKILGYTTP